MSFEIPASIEPEVKQYADAQRITLDEAILRLLQVGLAKKTPAQLGLGLFNSPEDAEALDAAVALAYEERRRPSQRLSGM
jgi:hypothetical protein